MQTQTNITLTPSQVEKVKELKGKITDEALARKIGVGIGKLKVNLLLMGYTRKRLKKSSKPVAPAGNYFNWEVFKKSDFIFNAA